METIVYPKETKARKNHTCNFCNEIIVKGVVYIKSTHVYDGIYDWRTHKNCSEIAIRLDMYDDCDEGVTMDDFMEFISEKHNDILINQVPVKDRTMYSDIFQQLRMVKFKYKLSFVISHIDKLDSN